MAIINGLRLIRNADFRLMLPVYDSAGPVPKLNAAGAPGSVTITLCKDKDPGGFGALGGGGSAASLVGQELIELDLAALNGDTDWKECLVKAVLTTHGLTPVVYGPFHTEECVESGICPNAHNADQTTTKVYLRAGASAVDDFYNLMVLEVVDAATGTSEASYGHKRLIVDYDGTDKFCTLLTPLPVLLDDVCQYKITAVPTGEALQQLLYESGVLWGPCSGTPTTTGVTVSALAGLGANGLVNSCMICLSGANKGLFRQITGYTTGTGAFVVDAFPTAPTAGDIFAVTGSFG